MKVFNLRTLYILVRKFCNISYLLREESNEKKPGTKLI